MHLVALGDDEQAGGVAVQAVHDPGAPVLLAARDATGERLRKRAMAMPARRMHDHPDGLVDDDQVLVLERDGEVRHRLGAAGRIGRALLVEHHQPLAAAHADALARGLAVDPHEPALDQPRRLRARSDGRREERVEALPGRVKRDVELDHCAP